MQLDEREQGTVGERADGNARGLDQGQFARGESRAPLWQRAHDELTRLASVRAHLDGVEAHWLLVASREGTHARLGYASFIEYVERLFGYSPRWTLEKLRVAESLERLPETRKALVDGSLRWSAVRELTRVATPETETDWLGMAAGKTARDIERLVSGHALGSEPGDAPDPAAGRHVIRFEVSGQTLASFREAMAKVRRDAGEPLDDDALLLLLARQVLGGPGDEGRASYQVSLSVCEHCRRGFQAGKGELVEVARETVEMAACDARRVRNASRAAVDNSTHVGGDDGERRPTPTPHEVCGTRATRTTNATGATGKVGRTGATRAMATTRATQTIPPSVRRRVLARDSSRCAVPGCRHAVFLDVHHIEPRADGGRHHLDNLVTLCGAHHRAVHRGTLLIHRELAGGFRYLHGDGSDYGSGDVSPRVAEACAKAFRALRSLGFRETETRRALQREASDAGSEATIEELLRSALRDLTRAVAA